MIRPLELVGRAWDAAFELDDLRGDRAASEWCARRVHDLLHEDRSEDVVALKKLARLLENRLLRERQKKRQEVEA